MWLLNKALNMEFIVTEMANSASLLYSMHYTLYLYDL
jgi:hypothetical protein